MAFDGITAHLLARELDNKLSGGRIDKVYQPDKQTVIVTIRANAKMEKLLISANPSCVRMNLTSSTRENPKMPPSFCMLLRKYLSGAKIESISSPCYERIIEIKVSNNDELADLKHYTLICELMGRYSNIILCNESGKIIDCLNHVDMSVNRVREVMPARIYSYPPTQDKMSVNQALVLCDAGKTPIKDEELGRPADKALLNSVKGLSPILTRRIAAKIDADDRTPIRDCSNSIKEALIREAASLFKSILDFEITPCVYYSEDDIPTDYGPFFFECPGRIIKTESISQAIDRFYESKDKAIDLDRKKHELSLVVDVALSHAVRKYDIHKNDYEEGRKADDYKKCGDLILANTWLLKGHETEFTCDDYYTEPMSKITIKLDPSMDASANAQDYYKRFRKAKRKYQMSECYIESDKEAITYFRSLKTAVAAASCEEDIDALTSEIRSLASTEKKTAVPKPGTSGYVDPNRTVGMAKSGKASSRAMREAARRAQMRNKEISQKKPKQTSSSYRKYYTSDGYEILCGRNNIQNDELTFKVADKEDWWFHIKGLPGTHVILKTRKGEEFPSDNAVLEAASLAVFFSKSIMVEEHAEGKGSHAGEIKAEVDYCPVSHVKKIPGAKPGMVIYESYYSVLVSALEPKQARD
ncbi:MAG: NFACT family protein [Saccharofermentans sp.]|nr:NFACT family protein [Saccharofermentans sp.]